MRHKIKSNVYTSKTRELMQNSSTHVFPVHYGVKHGYENTGLVIFE